MTDDKLLNTQETVKDVEACFKMKEKLSDTQEEQNDGIDSDSTCQDEYVESNEDKHERIKPTQGSMYLMPIKHLPELI